MAETDSSPDRFDRRLTFDPAVSSLPPHLQRLLRIVAMAANEAQSVREAFAHCLETVCAYTGWPLGHAFLREREGDVYRSAGVWQVEEAGSFSHLRDALERMAPRLGERLIGEVAAGAELRFVPDIGAHPDMAGCHEGELDGYSAVFVPVPAAGQPAAVLDFYFPGAEEPQPELLRVLRMIGSQVGRVVERERAEEALRLSEAMFAGIITISSDAIVSVDAEQRIISFNQGAETIFEYTAEEAIGQHLDILIPERYRPDHRHHVEDFGAGPVAARRMGERGQIVGRRKSGEVFQADASISKLEVAGRRIYTAVLRDVTERVRAEQELARSNAELEQFAYVASHDLQEPLRMVASYTQLLARRYSDKLDDDAREFIAFAVDGVTRMQALINDLLTFSRVGTRGETPEPTDTGAIVDRVLVNLGPAIEDAGASVTRDPLPTVIVDAGQFNQVFQNLIANALKFRKPNEPSRVHISARRGAGEWIFSVADNGIGIAPEFADRIFVLFQRLHSRAEYPGTGIGLSICKKVVERHGGRIWLESEPGQGTTFLFTVPDRPQGGA
ncbi:MAG TPA: ATP-binding protein [Longimicrobiaceae bacterium]